MSSDDFEHQMDFILRQQATFSSEMIELKQSIAELRDAQKEQSENLDKLTSVVGSVIEEMRDGFNKLIIANEATRDFANKIASLEIQTSQRVTGLEHRVSDIEKNQ